ncbi:hypothetical protein [Paraglaciecola sp. L3A3]|uniref:hypothetical protein n=1 Tax=Paraglaciecola sp. L3A3 TaxID=2686358 RepID=UPI00131CF4B1|nr:hypothetical protein [Paraglaciecola sp. L3A3]
MISLFLTPATYISKLVKLNQMCLLLIVLAVIGCGGKSIDNRPPSVEIVDVNFVHVVTDVIDPANRIVTAEAKASDSDGSITAINWSILSEHQIDLRDADTEIVEFNAPLINSDEIDLLVLEVEVTDNSGSKTTATIELDLNDDLVINIPLVSAQRGQEAVVTVNIFGRASKIAGLNWSMPDDPDIILFDANTDTVRFLAPSSSSISEMKLSLLVSFIDGSEDKIYNSFITLHD